VLVRERDALARNATRLRAGLRALGFDAGGDTHIIAVIVGDTRATLRLGDALRARGVLAHPIRPPTVLEGTARLRVTPMATHDESQIDRALASFAEAGRESGLLR